MPTNHQLSRRGFTLVEMLCVVVVLGIAATLVIPGIAGRADLKLAAAARVVVSQLQYAQSRAITTQRPHLVAFDADAQTLTVLAVPEGGGEPAAIVHPADQRPFVTRLGPGGEIDGVTLAGIDVDGRTVLAFDEMGEPLACDLDGTGRLALPAPAVVTLEVGAEQLEIHVQPFTGEVGVPTN